MRSSTMTPIPPLSAWLSRAGNGFQMSNTRKSRNAVTSTGIERGSPITESSMPATSSITITPGSLRPSTRSTREPAQRPTSVTTTRVTRRPNVVHGRSQMKTRVTKLPTVPEAIGAEAAPKTLAARKAARSRRPSGLFPDELVTVYLDDRDLREAARSQPSVAQQHHAVDLGRLSRGAALEGKRRIRARPVHQHGPARAVEEPLTLP